MLIGSLQLQQLTEPEYAQKLFDNAEREEKNVYTLGENRSFIRSVNVQDYFPPTYIMAGIAGAIGAIVIGTYFIRKEKNSDK